MKRDNPYVSWGITAVAVVCSILLFYDIVFRGSTILTYGAMLVRILAPVLYGAVMAYLLAPAVNRIESLVAPRSKKLGKQKTWLRGISILVTWLLVVAILYALMLVLLPELITEERVSAYALATKTATTNLELFGGTSMKRMIHSLLAAAVLVSAMTCTAFAATTDYSVDSTSPEADKTMDAPYVGEIVPSADGKSFTVSYDGAKSGEQYVLLIVKLNSDGTYNAADENNIIYINQDAAASDGTITFEDLIPMTSANAVVLLGGVFDGDVTSPVVLGELKVPYVPGDVTSDGEISIADAIKLLQYVAGVPGATMSATELLAADVDDSFVGINISDAVLLLQYVAGVPGANLPQ